MEPEQFIMEMGNRIIDSPAMLPRPQKRPCDTRGTHGIELVSIRQDLRFQKCRLFRSSIAVGPDRLGNLGDKGGVVANGKKELFGHPRPFHLVHKSFLFLEGPGDIVKKCCGDKNTEVCPLAFPDTPAQGDNPFRVIHPVRAPLPEDTRCVIVDSFEISCHLFCHRVT
jgi:hypothetical protein